MTKYLAFLSLVILTSQSFSQSSQSILSICASVDGDGNCYLDNTKFITSPGKNDGLFFMMLTNRSGLNTQAINFKISKIDDKGLETPINNLRQDVGADWIFAWKSELFNSPGKYSVAVYDNNGIKLDKKSFELIRFE